MGEQSNAYRILLRYDRKSRHRRIKKQRRYERLAATSQFRYTDRLLACRRPSHFSAPCGPVDGCTLSGGRSPYLRYADRWVAYPHLGERWTAQLWHAGSRVGCGSSPFFRLLPACPRADYAWRCYLPRLGTKDLESSPHPGVLPDRVLARYGQTVRLVSVGKRLGLNKALIPVVQDSVDRIDFKARGKPPSSLNSISAETDYILSLRGPLPSSRWTLSPRRGVGCGLTNLRRCYHPLGH